MKRTIIAVTALIALLITIAAVAQPRPPRGARPDGNRLEGPPPGEMGPQRGPGARGPVLPPAALAKFLNLSDAQIAQAKSIHESNGEANQGLREQLRANHEAVRNAIESGNATAAAEAMVAGEKLRDQMKAAREKQKAAFAAILNADQKAKFAILQEIEGLRHQRPNED